MVKAQRVTMDDAVLLDPASREWSGVRAVELSLQPTPIASQPSVYVLAKWKDKPYGVTQRVSVRAAHNGERLYFRLSWADDTNNDGIRDTDQFTDAAAVLFPVNGNAVLQNMGSPREPVNAWYWRSDLEEPFNVTAQGVGTTLRTQDPELGARAAYGDGAWNIVIRRRLVHAADAGLSHSQGYVNLVAGASEMVGFAVWQGANQERGGLKAITPDWEPLEIEA
jgi:DMSO reductase family type II enzyme heme b subunit